MTFTPDGGDVPLIWGQVFGSETKTTPRKKKQYKHAQHPVVGNLRQRVAIGLLLVFNISLVGATVASRSHADQVASARQVQALVAPTPVADAGKVQPVQAPAAVEAKVEVETVQPTPTPTAAVLAASTSRPSLAPSVGDWDSLLQQYFGAAWTAAKRVMLCESGGNAHAINRSSGATGLMQIMPLPGRPSQEALLDPAVNIATAYKIYAAQGWRPWTCQP